MLCDGGDSSRVPAETGHPPSRPQPAAGLGRDGGNAPGGGEEQSGQHQPGWRPRPGAAAARCTRGRLFLSLNIYKYIS